MSLPLPTIPTIPSSVDARVRQAIAALASYLAQAQKAGGIVTADELRTAVAAVAPTGVTSTTPPEPAGFTATGIFRHIILSWDDPDYSQFAYVEIWRSTTNDIGDAVFVGTTTVRGYTDIPPDASLSVTYYYWIRFISSQAVVGPWSDVASTATASDPKYLLQVLSEELAKVTPTTSVPDLVFAANRFALKMGGGGTDPAVFPFIVAEVPGALGTYGVFIDVAFIADATITTAMIESLATDKLVAGDALIGSALIEELSASKISAGTLDSDEVSIGGAALVIPVDRVLSDVIATDDLLAEWHTEDITVTAKTVNMPYYFSFYCEGQPTNTQVPYVTITCYDGDGTTQLKGFIAAGQEIPSHTPRVSPIQISNSFSPTMVGTAKIKIKTACINLEAVDFKNGNLFVQVSKS